MKRSLKMHFLCLVSASQLFFSFFHTSFSLTIIPKRGCHRSTDCSDYYAVYNKTLKMYVKSYKVTTMHYCVQNTVKYSEQNWHVNNGTIIGTLKH